MKIASMADVIDLPVAPPRAPDELLTLLLGLAEKTLFPPAKVRTSEKALAALADEIEAELRRVREYPRVIDTDCDMLVMALGELENARADGEAARAELLRVCAINLVVIICVRTCRPITLNQAAMP